MGTALLWKDPQLPCVRDTAPCVRHSFKRLMTFGPAAEVSIDLVDGTEEDPKPIVLAETPGGPILSGFFRGDST